MPQLIAMIVVVVGAMIYMFSTFGGTGNKIMSIAQKSTVLTEINNIKSGVNLALEGGNIKKGTTLRDLASLGYFDNSINEQLLRDDISFENTLKATRDKYYSGRNRYMNGSISKNTYSAISFGGREEPSMLISLLTGFNSRVKTPIPGLRVKFMGKLKESAKFLELQIAKDLENLSIIDKYDFWGQTWLTSQEKNNANWHKKGEYWLYVPKTKNTSTFTMVKGKYKRHILNLDEDGIFTIYFTNYNEKMR